MISLDTKFTMLLRELIQHEVNVITDSDWFQEKVNEAIEMPFRLKESDSEKS